MRAGATMVQGTLLGFGERCGNAKLTTIIPNLQLKLGHRCIPDKNMPMLTTVARQVAEIALVENLQRRDLDFFEEAEGLARLLAEQNLTQEQAAATLGKTQSTIANKLRLLKLDPGLRAKIRKAGLTERHARALLRLPEELRETALSRILSQKLTVAATDRLVDRLLEPQPVPAPRKKAIVKDVRLFLNTVDRALSIMKTSGIPARAEMQERDGCYEYRILIPK